MFRKENFLRYQKFCTFSYPFTSPGDSMELIGAMHEHISPSHKRYVEQRICDRYWFCVSLFFGMTFKQLLWQT